MEVQHKHSNNDAAASTVGQWLRFAVALFALNFALSFHNIWPTPWIKARPELSVEIAALVLMLAFHQQWFGKASRRFVAVLAGVLLILVIGRYMEVTAPALYGRAVNLYWDAQHLPAVAAMLTEAVPTYAAIGIVAGLVALLGAVYWILFACLSRLVRILTHPRPTRYLQMGAAFVVGVYLLGYHTSLPTLHWFSIPVSYTYTQQARFVIDNVLGESTTIATLPTDSTLDVIELDQKPQNDVIFTFIESYGAVAFDVESIDTALGLDREALAATIERTGRKVVSAYIEPPTFGGASWLSHISFMTGLNITESASYDALLTQARLTLPQLYREAGYRAVALMPGLKSQWPEGSFYGFDEIYGAAELGYEGPSFGWWRIPDQFSLARLRQLELANQGRPRAFVFFPTISTHTPFRPTPPYQPDWQRLVSAAPFTVAELGNSLTESQEWMNLRPSYADALAYTYKYWAGYFEAYAAEDSLFVLIGDHQPPAGISGEGARWDVPIHVISRSDELVDRLIEHGFVPGLRPALTPVAAMHELGPILFK